MKITRREFSRYGGAIAALASSLKADTGKVKTPFRLSVITDEITQDFDKACHIAADEFGLEWVEVREMWKKNSIALDSNEIAEAKRILQKYSLRVTDIASPLFKVDWEGAPRSKFSPKRDEFKADWTFAQQGEVLDRSISLAKALNTERIRGFDFWRLDDQAPYRAAMNDKLRQAAETIGKNGLLFILENEMSCNTATGPEAAKVLDAIPSAHFMLNWDPGNAFAAGEARPYPDGYDLLPKNRIGHCHCKDSIRKPDGKYDWAPVGKGSVDWVGQFKAFKRDGYHYAVSLETHWRDAGSPEASTRISMAGLKDTLRKADCLS
ncbi:MAG: sugar phosphate isomerase/epimerase [Acidobacteriaceae bacterium]|nr:sugar phosphate isomerase/epimerase [Acidobacteriaceae bacterium]MBV9502480.1 sugar phosphate isomerase/epimerase [Acidobacteriaceae bacterium]